MRLNSIKLSGFKSFAEPTNFLLPGKLVGVVGPNGCGKSNIIDAVRWVLGESRASELRGESMQDVIFNGTTTRKAASRSSVELIFDNSDFRAGGQWNQYAEIAVKRVLTRDGTSSYYINNQPVRRRDVQDVFLGTGLGSRAYAIIGQGTISQIIESKPEDLRLFLEEAAGVSKYKERRRETENRLSDTRENLTRVEDILRELNTQLEKLEKQAEVAQNYNNLQSDVTLKQHQLWYLKRQEASKDQNQIKEQAEKASNALESRIADLRRIEADLESIRQAHYTAGDQVNQAQGFLYEASAEVGKLEAEIRFVVQGRQRVEQRLDQIKQQTVLWSEQTTQAQQKLTQLEQTASQSEEKSAQISQQLNEQRQQIPVVETAWRQAQENAQEQRNSVVQIQQQIQVLAADQRSIQEQNQQLQNRQEKLHADRNAINAPDHGQLVEIKNKLEAAQKTAQEDDARLQELQTQVPTLDQERKQAQTVVNQENVKESDLSARSQALKALQEKVKTDERLKPWLGKHGLEKLEPLWRRIRIEAGWENALEAALREKLAALEVSRLDSIKSFGEDAPPSKLAFYTPSGIPGAEPSSSLQQRLVDLLRLHDAGQKALMTDWLHGCFVAKSIEEALALRTQLKLGEMIFVPNGHAISTHSVVFYAPDNEQAGLLARAQEIENLDKQLRAQSFISEEARNRLIKAEMAYSQASQQLLQVRQAATASQSQAHIVQVEFLRLSQQAEQTLTRAHQLEEDLSEIKMQLASLSERKDNSNIQFEELDMQLANSQERHAQLEDAVIAANHQLENAREQLRNLDRQIQEADFEKRTRVARESELQRLIETASTQSQAIETEKLSLQDELSRLSDAAAQLGLQSALNVKMEREAALSAKRSAYDDLTAKLRTSDERRLVLERELDPLRQRITDLQLKEQASRLGFEQYDQLLIDAQTDLEVLAKSIEEGQVRLTGLQSEIDKIQRQVQSLGAVNLAALEELTTSRERKTFLDAQSADLNEAIQTLEDAIKKIDGETRGLLGGTFKTVNEHFGRMFPELFGGGNAKLVMTGEEILDSGVQV
ncbi:MAG: chromosome segregation protein SMC, partial [Limnohabitans sp.]|nr:chromosome segregation protein SMC [Limnohabitans sp.]